MNKLRSFISLMFAGKPSNAMTPEEEAYLDQRLDTVQPSAMEDKLIAVFKDLLKVTDNKSARRIIVTRWFNRLYYDVRKWNDEFIKLLHTYPGYGNKVSKKDYDNFFRSMSIYWRSLEVHHSYSTPSQLEIDLCLNLSILAERYQVDFDWLKTENYATYMRVFNLIDGTHNAPQEFIELVNSVFEFIMSIDHNNLKWQIKNKNKIIKKINEYEEISRQKTNEIRQLAIEAGVSLLSIDEYETALNEENFNNSVVIVAGDVVTGDKNLANDGGVINSGSSNITNNISRQSWSNSNNTINFTLLSKELTQLRKEMSKSAKTKMQKDAVMEIEKAEKAAKSDDKEGVMRHLKAAGKWALDVGTAIGTNLVIELLKNVSGLK